MRTKEQIQEQINAAARRSYQKHKKEILNRSRTKYESDPSARLSSIYYAMRSRCLYSTNKRFARYGGRGIKISPVWLNDKEAFITWALANGYKRGLFIDRTNNDGDYSPENCKWVTCRESVWNRECNKTRNDLPRGVSASLKKFRASITTGGKKVYLGSFNTPEEASKAFQIAYEKKLSLKINN